MITRFHASQQCFEKTHPKISIDSWFELWIQLPDCFKNKKNQSLIINSPHCNCNFIIFLEIIATITNVLFLMFICLCCSFELNPCGHFNAAIKYSFNAFCEIRYDDDDDNDGH